VLRAKLVQKENLADRQKLKVWEVYGKDLTDSVNQMASNLTAQVRNIAEVTTAVQKVTCQEKLQWM